MIKLKVNKELRALGQSVAILCFAWKVLKRTWKKSKIKILSAFDKKTKKQKSSGQVAIYRK